MSLSLRSPPTKIPYEPLLFPIALQFIPLDSIIRLVFAEEYRSQSSSICSLLHRPVTSSLLLPNIFLSNPSTHPRPMFLPQFDRPSFITIDNYILSFCGPGSPVGIATGYGLDIEGIESRWGRDILHLSRPALGSTQPPVQWVPGLSWG